MWHELSGVSASESAGTGAQCAATRMTATVSAVMAEATSDAQSTRMEDEEENGFREVGTMLVHPVFVFWCVSCGQEAPEDVQTCPRCAGRVHRHQRVLELPDPPAGSNKRGRTGDGLLCLRSLKAALADISVGEGVGGSALLLSEQGADPDVAEECPALAGRLAALAVPPAVQRALVQRGFVSWEQIAAAMANTTDVDVLATQLGVSSPAAEVLLRRLCNAVVDEAVDEARIFAGPSKRLNADVLNPFDACDCDVQVGQGEAAGVMDEW